MNVADSRSAKMPEPEQRVERSMLALGGNQEYHRGAEVQMLRT